MTSKLALVSASLLSPQPPALTVPGASCNSGKGQDDYRVLPAQPLTAWTLRLLVSHLPGPRVARGLCQPVCVQQDIGWQQKSIVWAELTAVMLLLRFLRWVLLTVQAGLELMILWP